LHFLTRSPDSLFPRTSSLSAYRFSQGLFFSLTPPNFPESRRALSRGIRLASSPQTSVLRCLTRAFSLTGLTLYSSSRRHAGRVSHFGANSGGAVGYFAVGMAHSQKTTFIFFQNSPRSNGSYDWVSTSRRRLNRDGGFSLVYTCFYLPPPYELYCHSRAFLFLLLTSDGTIFFFGSKAHWADGSSSNSDHAG